MKFYTFGQSYGEDGKRTALDRLGSHSTLQGIYAESIHRNPDSDIWILLASFKQVNFISLNGMVKSDDNFSKLDTERFVKSSSEGVNISEQQKINFTEAALIRYFQPKYNKEYKATFPSPAHKTYDDCYKLDINAVIAELDTSEMRRSLYSNAVNKNTYHSPTYYLINNEERYKMFHWFE